MSIQFPLPLKLRNFICASALISTTTLLAITHNPTLRIGPKDATVSTSQSVLLVAKPIEDSPTVPVLVNWRSDPPTDGTLTITIEEGISKIIVSDISENGKLNDNVVTWTKAFPNGKAFMIKPRGISHAEGDIKLKLVYKSEDETESAMRSTKLTAVRVRLSEVSFCSNEGKNNCVTVWEDAEGINPYIEPQWKDYYYFHNDSGQYDNEIKSTSVAFVKNTTPAISAIFDVTPPIDEYFRLEVSGINGLKLKKTIKAVKKDGNATLNLTKQPFDNSFPDRIALHDNAALTWTVSIVDGSSAKITTTKHRIYVIWGNSVDSNNRETYFYLGCKNAEGKKDLLDVVWDNFSTKKVTRADGAELFYYKTDEEFNIDPNLFLVKKDGNCATWSKFFIQVLKSNGYLAKAETIHYDVPMQNVMVGESSPNSLSFVLIKNWRFIDHPTARSSTHPHENIYINPPDIFTGSRPYPTWLKQEFFDLIGKSGQNREDPPSVFGKHILVRIGDTFYDPSYGNGPYDSIDTWANDSLAGFAAHVPLEFEGNKIKCVLFARKIK